MLTATSSPLDRQLKPEQQALPHGEYVSSPHLRDLELTLNPLLPPLCKQTAEAHLYLAQHFYELRMQELRAEIEAKEQKFRLVFRFIHFRQDRHSYPSYFLNLTATPGSL